MIGYIFLAFVLACTSYAAYLDLKTTEVPDAISLLLGGGATLYYLSHSITLPFTHADAILVLATLCFAAGVATYLKLFCVLNDTAVPANVIERLDGTLGPFRISDIVGTALFAAAAVLFAFSTTVIGVSPVVESFIVGTILFALGWSMYLTGMWGGADAFVLGAVGYALPSLPQHVTPVYQSNLPFPVSLVLTVFMVGAVYSILYAIYLAFRNEDAIEQFWQDIRAYKRKLAALSALYTVTAVGIGYYLYAVNAVAAQTVLYNAVVFSLVFAAMLVLYRFLRVVEDDIMQTTIPAADLVPGDVLAADVELGEDMISADRIVGLTAEEVATIQEQQDTVTVKTGVKFIVAFPIAIILLATVGDPVYAAMYALA